MAKDKIKIGMQVVFEGVEGIKKMTTDIATALQELQRVLDANVAQVQIAFEGSGVEKLQLMLQQIGALAKDLNELFGQNAKKGVKLEIDKEAIDQLKHTIENTFNEVLSRTRKEFNEIADYFYDIIKLAFDELPKIGEAQEVSSVVSPGQSKNQNGNDQNLNVFSDQIQLISNELEQIPLAITSLVDEIKNISSVFENVFNDTLTNLSLTFDKIASDFSDQLSIALSTASSNGFSAPDPDQGAVPGGAFQNNNFLFNRPRTVKEANPEGIQNYAKKLSETLFEQIRASFSELIIANPEEAEALSKELGRTISIGFATGFRDATAGGYLETRAEQKRAIDSLGVVLNEIAKKEAILDKTKNTNKRDEIEDEIKVLKRQSEQLKATAFDYEKAAREISGYNQLVDKSIKLDDKQLQHEGDIAEYLKESNQLFEIVNSAEASAGSLEKLARPFELIVQSLRSTLQQNLRMKNFLEREAEGTESEIKRLEAKAKDPTSTKGEVEESERRIDTLQKKLAGLRGKKEIDPATGEVKEEIKGLIQAYEERADKYYKWTADIRILADQTRMWYRVLNEAPRVTENALKANERLGQSVPIVINQFKQLNKIGQQQQTLTEAEYGQVAAAINQRTKTIKDIDKNILSLEQGREQYIQNLEQMAEQKSGQFGGLDEAAIAQKLEKEIESVNKKINEGIEENIKRRKELINLEGESTALEKKQSQYELLLKLTKRAEEAERQYLTLEGVSQTSDTGGFSFFEGDFKNKDIQSQAAIIKQVRNEYSGLSKTIEELNRDYIALGDESSPKAIELARAIEVLSAKHAALTNEFFGSENQLAFASIESLAASLREVDSDLADLSQQYGNFQLRLQEAQKDLKGTNDEQLRGAQASLKMGSEAKSAEDKIRKHIKTLELLKDRTGSLTPVQQSQLRTLRELAEAYRNSAAGIAKKEWHLKRIERSTKDASIGFERYLASLSDSITGQFRFIQSAAIVGGALMGIRTAFTELQSESRAFARTMTVMQSNSMTMAQTYDALRDNVRAVAIEFGESVETAAEIVKQFGSAGLSAEESLMGLRDTMKLVIATQVSAEQASRAIAGIYNVFGKDIARTAGEMNVFAKINDVLTSTYRNHQVELDEMIQGMKYSASTGRAAGFAFEDIAAYLSILNDNMIKSGTAGRTLQVVFAQTAAKAEQLEKAFGFKFDKNKSLESQFLPLLEKANGLMSSGALTAAQLQTQFKLFDLRGARSFTVLATKVDDVRKALRRLKKESTGTADELASIVKNDLSKQFESARQSLIDLAKGALDPLKESMITINILIKDFAKGIKATGILEFISFLGMWGTSISFVVSSSLALIAVLTTLRTRGAAAVATQWSYVSSLWATNQANAAVAASSKIAASSMGASWAFATTKLLSWGAAAKTIFALMGGWYTVAIAAIMGIVWALGRAKNETERLNREFETLVGELRRVDSVSAGVKNLSRDMELIKRQLDRGAIAAEVAGDRIRQAFEDAGHLSISQAAIMGKSNVEIAKSYDVISESVKKQIQLQEELGRIERRRLSEKLVENIKGRVEGVSKSNFAYRTTAPARDYLSKSAAFQAFSTQIAMATGKDVTKENKLGLDFFKAYDAQTTRYRAPVEGFIQDIELAQKQVEKLSSQITEDLSDSAKEKLAKDIEEVKQIGLEASNSYKDAIEVYKKGFNDLITEGGFTFKGAEDEIRKILKDLNYSKDVIEKIIKDMKRIEKIGLGIEKLEPTDAFSATAVAFYELNKFIGGVTDPEKFYELSDRMKDLESDTADVTKAAIKLSQAFGIIEGELPDEIKLNVELLPENLKFDPKVLTSGLENLIVTSNVSQELKEILIRELESDIQYASPAGYGVSSSRSNILNDNEKGYRDLFLDQGGEELDNIDRKLKNVLERSVRIRAITGGTADEYGRIATNAQGLADLFSRVTGIMGNYFIESSEQLKQAEATFDNEIAIQQARGASAEEINKIVEAKEKELSILRETISDQRKVFQGYLDFIKEQSISLMLEQKRNDIIKDYLVLLESAAKAQTILNSRRQKTFEIDTKLQKLESTSILIQDSYDKESFTLDREKILEFINKISSDMSGGSVEDNQRQLENAMKQAEVAKELWDTYYAIARAKKDLLIYDTKNEQKLKESQLLNKQIRRNIRGQAEDQKKASETLLMSVRHRYQMLLLEEKLTGVYEDQVEALIEIEGMIGEITKSLNDSVDLYFSQAQTLWSTLGALEQILNAEKEYAGFQQRVMGAAVSINKILVERKNIEEAFNDDGDAALRQRRLIDLYSSQLDFLKEFIKLEDKLKELEKEKTRFVDERLNIYMKIVKFAKEQEDFLTDNLRQLIERSFETDKIKTAVEIASAIGWRFVDVIKNQTGATDKLIEGVRNGTVAVEGLSPALQNVVKWSEKAAESTNALTKRTYDFIKADQDLTLENFDKFRAEGNFNGMEAMLRRYEKLMEDKKSLDAEALEGVDLDFEYRDELAKMLELIPQLTAQIDQQKLDYVFSLSFKNETEMREMIDLVKGFLGTIKTQLEGIAQIDAAQAIVKLRESINSDGNIIQFTSDIIFDDLGKQLEGLKGAIDNLTGKVDDVTATKVVPSEAKRMATGGPVPGGYGGGDIVPAMLEPGEFVIPKHIVKKMGRSFMEDLRRGKIRGYNQGGEVGAASARFYIENAKSKASIGAESHAKFVALASLVNERLLSAAEKFKESADSFNSAASTVKRTTSSTTAAATFTSTTVTGSEAANQLGADSANAARMVQTVSEVAGIAKKAIEQIVTDAKSLNKEETKETYKEIGEEIINRSAIRTAIRDSIVSGASKAREFISSAMEVVTNIDFAYENAEVFKEYSKQLEEIDKQFKDQFETITKGLRRNESSYYDYINALQDAEKQRFDQMLEAEKTYRESLKKTQDVIGETLKNSSVGIFSSMSSGIEGVFSTFGKQAFGDLSENISTFVGSSRQASEVRGKIDRETEKVLGKDPTNDQISQAIDSGLLDISNDLVSLAEATKQGDEALSLVVSQSLFSLGGSILSGVVSGMSSLLSLGFADDKTIEALKNFIEELPQAVVSFVNAFVENLDVILDAFVEGLPVILTALVDGIPKILEAIIIKLGEALPAILEAIAEALPELVRKLVPLILNLVLVLLSNVDKIVNILATIPGALLEGLINALLSKEFWKNLANAIISVMGLGIRLVVNALIGIFNAIPLMPDIPYLPDLPKFHEGGLIKGNYEDVMINAQSGEGVVSRQGMLAIGGASVLDKINSGINPFALERLESYNNPSMSSDISRTGSDMNVGYNRSMSSTDNSTTNNSISVSVNVNGPMTGSQVDKLSNQIVNDIDRKLAKKAQDRDSRLAKSLR